MTIEFKGGQFVIKLIYELCRINSKTCKIRKKKSTGLQEDTVRRLYIFFPNNFA